MPDSIDVRNLTDEQVEALKRLVRLFRKQRKKTKRGVPIQEEEFSLAAWDSNVTGRLTRKELYEDR